MKGAGFILDRKPENPEPGIWVAHVQVGAADFLDRSCGWVPQWAHAASVTGSAAAANRQLNCAQRCLAVIKRPAGFPKGPTASRAGERKPTAAAKRCATSRAHLPVRV
jgi:hypothetical protein